MMVQALDNDRKVAYCTPAKPRFIGFEAAHQSIHEREGAYLDLQDLEDLPVRGVLLFKPGENRTPVGRVQISQKLCKALDSRQY